jgi:two-component system response regulator NreC
VTIAVVLLEDHTVVREGVRLVLERERDIEVVAEAALLAELGDVTASPDVVVADLSIEDCPGADVVPAVTERFPGTAVLVLTMVKDAAKVEEVLAAGASGYVLKEAAGNDLVEAVRQVAAGGTYLEASLGFEVIRRARAQRSSPLPALSERETEVLRLLALGHTNTAISDQLGVSLRTVEADRSRLLRALGATSRADLVRAAMEAGLLSD